MIVLYMLAEMETMDRRMTGSALVGKGRRMMLDRKEVAIQDLKLVYEYIRKEVHDIASCKCRMLDKVNDVIALLQEQGDEITALSIALAMYEKQDIVRCKDCKHYKPYRGRVSGNLLHECEIFDLDIDDPDWFCANGERRDEND